MAVNQRCDNKNAEIDMNFAKLKFETQKNGNVLVSQNGFTPTQGLAIAVKGITEKMFAK